MKRPQKPRAGQTLAHSSCHWPRPALASAILPPNCPRNDDPGLDWLTSRQPIEHMFASVSRCRRSGRRTLLIGRPPNSEGLRLSVDPIISYLGRRTRFLDPDPVLPTVQRCDTWVPRAGTRSSEHRGRTRRRHRALPIIRQRTLSPAHVRGHEKVPRSLPI
jgi:hypothetical protein